MSFTENPNATPALPPSADTSAAQGQTDAANQQFAQNINFLALHHPWMPNDTAMGLATSGMSPGVLGTVADALGNVASTAGADIHFLYGDPVLQKQQTAMTALKQYVTNTIGPPPIEAGTITSIQAQLQNKGFGQNLPTGLWTPAWKGAWDQYKQAVSQSQLSGNKPGSKSAGGILHMLADVLPKEAGNAIIGWVKSVPHEVRHMLADSMSGAGYVPGPGDLLHAIDPKAANRLGATIAGQTPEQFTKQSGISRTFDDVSTALMFVSLAGMGKGVATGIGEQIAKGSTLPWRQGLQWLSGNDARLAAQQAAEETAGQGGQAYAQRYAANLAARAAAKELGLQEAYRGPGVIANTIGRTADLAGAGIGKIADAPFLQNIPALDRVGPWVGKLNDADGLYYRLRTMAALPYQMAPVRVAGQATGALGTAGIEARVQAAGSKALDPNSTLANDVEGTHTLDAVDGALKRNAAFSAFGVHFTPQIDDLAFLLHPSDLAHNAATPAKLIAGQAEAAHHTITDLIGRVGIAGIAERATGLTIPQLMAQGGVKSAADEVAFNKWLTAKINTFAVRLEGEKQAAQEAANTQLIPGSDKWITDLQRPIENELYADPQKVADAREFLLSQPEKAEEMWRKEIVDSGIRGTNELTNGLDQYLVASRHVTNGVLPYQDLLIHDANLARNMEAAELVRAREANDGFLPHDDAPRQVNPGQIGLARKSTVTKRMALAQADKFEKQYSDLSTVPRQEGGIVKGRPIKDTAALDAKIDDYLYGQLGINARKMAGQTTDKINQIRQRAELLASDVHYDSETAPDDLRAAFSHISDAGYKVVLGNDIGWAHTDLPTMDVTEGPITYRRKMVEKMMLAPERVSPYPIGAMKAIGAKDELQKVLDKWEARGEAGAPYYNAEAIYGDMNDPNLLRRTGTPMERGMYEIFNRGQDLDNKRLRQAVMSRLGPGASRTDVDRLVEAQARDEITAAAGIQNIPKKAVIGVLTRKDWIPDSTAARQLFDSAHAGHPDLETPLFTEKQARELYNAAMRGAAKATRSYMVGATKLEDMMRGGFGFMGEALPGAMGERVANLPNAYIQARNKLRFALSPELSLRKIAKTNAQLAINDVTPTLRPAHWLKQAGVYDDAVALHHQLVPGSFAGSTDSAEQMLQANDIFHFYNHDDYGAYAAWHWKQQGLSDEQIQERLVRVMDYGSYTGGKLGRSAAERTLNFFFFPFSFDKKLYRSFGYYLLDHPAQTLLLDHSLAAYKQFNDAHPNAIGSAPWLQKHVPILTELTRLNAFAHGVGLATPGIVGSLNAPVFNAFMPQMLRMKKDELGQTGNLLRQAIPAFKTIQNVIKEGGQQAKIVGTGLGNRWDDIFGKAPSSMAGLQFKNIRQVNETHAASFQDGNAAYQQAVADFSTFIDWNDTHSAPDQKYRLPLDPKFGKFAGEVLDKSTIGAIVHERYPGFDPNLAAAYAIKNKNAVQSYMLSVKGTPEGNLINALLDKADKLDKGLQTGKVDLYGNGHSVPLTVAQRARIQEMIRTDAMHIAEKDPNFYRIWDKYFANYYGPLEQASV